MDIVPVSLAIAQAAKESGWGTSRFAIEGNALLVSGHGLGKALSLRVLILEEKHKVMKFKVFKGFCQSLSKKFKYSRKLQKV